MNRFLFALFSAAMIFAVPAPVHAQAQQNAQAQAALNNAAVRARIMAAVKASGMSADQIRLQLKSMGYTDDVINQVVGGPGSDSTGVVRDDVFLALRSLGIADSAKVDSL